MSVTQHLNRMAGTYEILYEHVLLEVIWNPYYTISCKNCENNKRTKLLENQAGFSCLLIYKGKAIPVTGSEGP
jgi:hypothetical protein